MEFLGTPIPNHIVEWTLLIVTYPFFTGIIAGSTVVTALVYLMGRKELHGLERAGHFLALALLFTAPLCPGFDLKQPARAILVPIYANFSSPILLFFVLWVTLTVVMLVKSYYMFRRDFIARAQMGGIFGKLASLCCLGVTSANEEQDDKTVKVWAAISIPVGMFFHAYVGFLMVSMHSVPLWNGAILLLVFLVSALVSGVGAAMLIYIAGQKIFNEKIDVSILKLPVILMACFAGFDLFIVFIEYVSEWYWNTEHWHLIALAIGYNSLAYLIEIVGLLAILGFGLSKANTSLKAITWLSILSLVAVYAARWTMVIPAQMIEKGFRGIVFPHITITGREGLLEVLALFCLAAFLYIVFSSIAGWKTSVKHSH